MGDGGGEKSPYMFRRCVCVRVCECVNEDITKIENYFKKNLRKTFNVPIDIFYFTVAS